MNKYKENSMNKGAQRYDIKKKAHRDREQTI